MNFELYLANLWAYGLQVAILTLTAGLLCRLFQLRTPKVVLTCWQALLAVLLLLPVLEPSTPAALTASGAAGFRITFGSLAAARAAAGRWPAARIIIAVIIAGIAARLIWVLAGLYKLRLYRMRALLFSFPVTSRRQSRLAFDARLFCCRSAGSNSTGSSGKPSFATSCSTCDAMTGCFT